MLRFVIGVDRRSGRLGAEIERLLKRVYDIAEFEVVGVTGGLPCTSVGSVVQEVDCILAAVSEIPARFHMAVCVGRVFEYTPVGRIPRLVSVITALNQYGEALHDSIDWDMGMYVPVSQRNYTAGLRQPDLLDAIQSIVVDAAGLEAEPLPTF